MNPPFTPVNVANLSVELKHHPYQHFAASVLHDLQWGCNIGYTGPRSARITPNLKSALLHPDAVSAALAKEVFNWPHRRSLSLSTYPQSPMLPTWGSTQEGRHLAHYNGSLLPPWFFNQ